MKFGTKGYFSFRSLFQDTLVKSMLKQQQPFTFGVNLLLIKPGFTLFSKVFKYVSYVLSFKRFDYPMVTETVSFTFANCHQILDEDNSTVVKLVFSYIVGFE